jgi:hypothetical protein
LFCYAFQLIFFDDITLDLLDARATPLCDAHISIARCLRSPLAHDAAPASEKTQREDAARGAIFEETAYAGQRLPERRRRRAPR